MQKKPICHEYRLIVKIGGSIFIGSEGSVNRDILTMIGRDFVSCGYPIIVVHGTGGVGRAVLRQYKITTDFVPLINPGIRKAAYEFRRQVTQVCEGQREGVLLAIYLEDMVG